jgi:hypothetical protein
VRQNRFVFGQQWRNPICLGVGNNDPVEGISCPAFSKCHFRNDLKRMIADGQALRNSVIVTFMLLTVQHGVR